jgi:DNA-binding CsgD family transcriptional regulator
MPNENGYTDSEQKIVDLLADGKPHRPDEIRACLGGDALLTNKNISSHIYRIRRLLRHKNETIICQSEGTRKVYIQVKFLHS